MGLLTPLKNMFSDNSTIIKGSDASAVQAWMIERLAKQLKKDVTDIDPARPFEEYGLDSMFAVQVTAELEKVVEMRLSPALLFENTCIDDVAKVISNSAAETELQEVDHEPS
jgi:acyl carrier protein